MVKLIPDIVDVLLWISLIILSSHLEIDQTKKGSNFVKLFTVVGVDVGLASAIGVLSIVAVGLLGFCLYHWS